MNRLFILAAAGLLVTGAFAAYYVKQPRTYTHDRRDQSLIQSKNPGTDQPDVNHPAKDPQAGKSTQVNQAGNKKAPKIQVAVLLDVSNSMDGLIDQAKAQLWNMVSVLGNASCNDAKPTIEIALYEYGRPTNDIKAGYVKRINAFTGDLDEVSKNLFSLKTNGGDEFCGHVIYTSLQDLTWDESSSNYKVIFIAGNEDFLQGDVLYTKACTEAKKKGVIVNTIYCGDRMQGIREHWNLGSECGQGSFTIINQDAKIDDIATPYDSLLFVANDKLNKTYIGYGARGSSKMEEQKAVDGMNYSMNKSAAAKRVSVKSKKQLYDNSSWDLVDAADAGSGVIDQVDLKTLPDSLQKKSRAEIRQIVAVKSKERTDLQKEIATITVKREGYIAAEKAKGASGKAAATLETEVEKILRGQAKRFNIVIQ